MVNLATISSNWKKLSQTIKAKSKAGSKTLGGSDEPESTGQGKNLLCSGGGGAVAVSSARQTDVKNDGLWFEVEQLDLRRSETEKMRLGKGVVSVIDLFPKTSATDNHGAAIVGKYLALDCEFVGVGADGVDHALARVSIVNFHGQVVLDEYVRPSERVTDFRTAISGIRPSDLRNAVDFETIQARVDALIRDKVLVGHALKNDLTVLMLSHPHRFIRDTSKLRRFRAITHGRTPSLKRLARHVLGITIQTGEHDSVDDARVAMLLYRSCKDEWEDQLSRPQARNPSNRCKQKTDSRSGRKSVLTPGKDDENLPTEISSSPYEETKYK